MKIFTRIKKFVIKKRKKKLKILYNIFNTTNQKHALLSYVREVFENDSLIEDFGHTNRLTTMYIAEILADLGYNVDIINWDSDHNVDFNKYELTIGLGKPLEYILKNRNKDANPKVIWFGTGCNPIFSNEISLSRIVEFYSKSGKALLSSSRYIVEDWPLQHEIADWIILHGDTFAKSTYRNYNIDSILGPVFTCHSINRSDEDWINSKNNYLWFGSSGAIHKGLDILIDAFKNLSQYNLHICGNVESEKEFWELYKNEIINCKNIVYHGFVHIKSELFKEILSKCAFTIFPSASEGNSPSVITCMANGGLIPVVTEKADVNIEEYGIKISGFSEPDILDSINRSQNLSLSDLKEQSSRILKATREFHSFEFFKKDFKNKLADAIEKIEA